MALSTPARLRGARAAWCVLLLLAFACGDDARGATEVLLTLDASEGARDATFLRVQVNAAVVEVERKAWPVELLIRPKNGDAGRGIEVRAFAMDDGAVLGAAEASERFRKGQRKLLRLTLDPALQLGPPPAVNSEVDPDGMVAQPDGDDADGQDGSGDGGADGDSGDDAGLDGGQLELDGSPGADACAQGACVDAAAPDACVPSPDDCGVCGHTCEEGTQCLAGSCEPLPPAACKGYSFQQRVYVVCTDARNWSNARTACRDQGMDLVVIDDVDENAFVLTIAGGDAWIGASDRGENGSNCTRSKDEGLWYWVDPASGNERGDTLCAFSSSGADACTPPEGSYSAFRADEPDNDGCTCSILNPLLGSSCSEGSDCALFAASDGSWIDASCDSASRYICEQRMSD